MAILVSSILSSFFFASSNSDLVKTPSSYNLFNFFRSSTILAGSTLAIWVFSFFAILVDVFDAEYFPCSANSLLSSINPQAPSNFANLSSKLNLNHPFDPPSVQNIFKTPSSINLPLYKVPP